MFLFKKNVYITEFEADKHCDNEVASKTALFALLQDLGTIKATKKEASG